MKDTNVNGCGKLRRSAEWDRRCAKERICRTLAVECIKKKEEYMKINKNMSVNRDSRSKKAQVRLVHQIQDFR